MYRRILVIIDRSAFGAVLPTVAELARRFGSAVRLLSLREPSSHALLAPSRDALRRNAERYLALALRSQMDSVVTVIGDGEPDDEVVAEVESWGPDLVVMGQPRKSWLSRSRSDRMEACIARAGRPVLLVPATRRPAKRATNALDVRRVIVAVDGSPLPETGLAPASALSRLLGVPLTLVLVIPRDSDTGAKPPTAREAEHRLLEQEHADAYLVNLVARLRMQGIPATPKVVAEDDPARGILDAAAGDLIVMTSHGRQGLMRILLGSVSSRVVEGARGPVLILPSSATPSFIGRSADHES